MIFREYPGYSLATLQDVIDILRVIVYLRKDDIKQAQNLNNIYILGRKVAKIPANSSDVSPTDRIGDISYTPTAMYVLVDNAGTPEWVKSTLSTF